MTATVIARPQPYLPKLLRRVGLLRACALLLALMVGAPLLVIAFSWGDVNAEIWLHLAQTQLFRLLGNTFVLVLGVAVLVLLIGVPLAWFTATCDFPGRRVFDVVLMLPLAVPAYVMAFVMVGLLDYAGPVQGALRDWFGPQLSFSFRGTFPVVLVMSLVLYPYVYMLARSAFLSQGREPLEAARVLGYGPLQGFLRVALPMARPAIIAGLSLALMETLADFGAVAVFNYDTFTTAIYKAWYGFFDLQTAAQLASLLLVIVLSGLYLERSGRGSARYFQNGRRRNSSARIALSGSRAWLVSAWCGLVFLVAFVIPVGHLLLWIIQGAWRGLDERYLGLVGHTLTLAAIAAVVTVIAAFLLALYRRTYKGALSGGIVRLATVGYALPGSVLAVGIMLSFNWLDAWAAQLQTALGLSVQPIFVGGVLALLLAYTTRFLAAAFGPVETSLDRIKPSIPEAAAILGARPPEIVRRIYLPMLAPGLLTAALLVFVDVMKEMPATLLMRPFGWDTLAVRIYEMTSEGLWQQAALPGLSIVLVGLVPVVILVRRSAR
ncbi:iron ABC transporter permease [Ketobacter alkanivorans]|uniref:Iron ABC transporter permease n=2 Tax=Ketobacter alkanivorans TaxID=1917421 RepID=A0A2K9LPI1_9GAMM|nr:iron ABC transporter permease [Ketobacter alkanivorans]